MVVFEVGRCFDKTKDLNNGRKRWALTELHAAEIGRGQANQL